MLCYAMLCAHDVMLCHAWLRHEVPLLSLPQDAYVDTARTDPAKACLLAIRRARTKTQPHDGLQKLIKAEHDEVAQPWMLKEAHYRACTIRRWESERDMEFAARCYGDLPPRKPLLSASAGAPGLEHYRFFIRYQNWVACEQCGYRWQVHKGQLSGQR